MPAKTATRLPVTKQQHQQLEALQKHKGDREAPIQVLPAGERHQGITRAGIHLLAVLVEAANRINTVIGTLKATTHGGVAIRTTNHGEAARTTLGGLSIVKIMAAVCRQDHHQEGSLSEEYANTTRMGTAGRGHLAIMCTVDHRGWKHIVKLPRLTTFLYSLTSHFVVSLEQSSWCHSDASKYSLRS